MRLQLRASEDGSVSCYRAAEETHTLFKALSTGSRPGFHENLTALVAAQKPPRGTAAYSRFVNRPSARYVAAAGHSLGLTPNMATAISATMSGLALAVLAIAEPTKPVGVLIAVLLAGGYVMDSVDGQLARLRGEGSLSGEWLDHTVDTFKESFLHLAVLISWYRFPPVDEPTLLLVPIGFQVFSMVGYFGIMIMPGLRGKGGAPARSTDGAEHPLRKWLLLPEDYGVLCWIFVFLGWPLVFVPLYTAMCLAKAALVCVALRKWWRELRALDAARSFSTQG